MTDMTPLQKEQALNEARLTMNLKHPHIVVCHKAFITDQKLNIVLELCENRDLAHYLSLQNDVPLPEAKIWKLFMQICFGLLSLHEYKILHRDLKTANIFMTRDMSIKIGDLGVSRQM